MNETKKTSGSKTSVYLSSELKRKLGVQPFGIRKGGEAVSVLADRYYSLTVTERTKLLSLFSENEWELMRAVCVGVEWKPADKIRDGVLHLIQDALDLEFEQMKVSKTQIEGKLRSLSLLQQFSLVEELETFWKDINMETQEARNA